MMSASVVGDVVKLQGAREAAKSSPKGAAQVTAAISPRRNSVAFAQRRE
nr:hypothetical protein [Rhodococcus sp. 06-156-4]